MRLLKGGKLEDMPQKYMNKVYCHDNYMSICCWKTVKQVDNGISGLSANDELEASKNNSRRTFGIKLGCATSTLVKGWYQIILFRVDYTSENKVIPWKSIHNNQ